MSMPSRLFRGATYWSCIAQEVLKKRDNPINILVLFHEAQTFTPCQISDDVKGKVLEPSAKAARVPGTGIQLLGFIEKHAHCGADKWFIIDKGAHGKGIVHASAVPGVVLLVCGGKQRL